MPSPGDAMGQLQQFVARHEGCGGGVQPIEPTEADLADTGAWVSLRCPRCGDSVRVLLDYESQLRSIAQQAGIDWADFMRLSSTEAGLEELRRRLYAWPGLAPMVLAWRRQARSGEERN